MHPTAMTRARLHAAFVHAFAAPSESPPTPAARELLSNIESTLGTTFPCAFVEFLTVHGPVFTPEILTLVTGGESEQAPPGASFDIQQFLDPAEIIETHRLYVNGGMESWLIPFATDSGGNLFGFKRVESTQRQDDAPVFVFDHDFATIKQDAETFDAWLQSFLTMAGGQSEVQAGIHATGR